MQGTHGPPNKISCTQQFNNVNIGIAPLVAIKQDAQTKANDHRLRPERAPVQEYADGRSYLDAKPSLMCYSDEWYSRMPFAVLSFLLYGCGIPVLFFTVLYVNRTQLDTRHIKRRYGSIFLIYKKDCWYWETWMKVKKLFVMLSLNIFPEETTYQAILALIVLEIGIHLNGKHQARSTTRPHVLAMRASLWIPINMCSILTMNRCLRLSRSAFRTTTKCREWRP